MESKKFPERSLICMSSKLIRWKIDCILHWRGSSVLRRWKNVLTKPLKIKKLKPGYDVITDISKFSPVGLDALKEIERVQEYFRTSGVRYGVRIVGKSVVTGMQFKRIWKSVGFRSTNFDTLAEAEEFLDRQQWTLVSQYHGGKRGFLETVWYLESLSYGIRSM